MQSLKPNDKNAKYPPDFKLETLQRTLSGKSKRWTSTELCVNEGMIFLWVKKYPELGYNGIIIILNGLMHIMYRQQSLNNVILN